MKLEDLEKRFCAYSNLEYELYPPADDSLIQSVESHLDLTIPQRIRQFYQSYNGFQVIEPRVELFSINKLEFIGTNSLLKFAQVYGKSDLCFDTANLNSDCEWIIVTAEGFKITRSMGSFLSNKIWGFIGSEDPGWLDEVISLCRLGPVEAQLVWVFNTQSNSFPRALFTTKDAAEEWINKYCLSGTLSLYPVDIGSYEYSVRNGHFMPNGKHQTTAEFINKFGVAINHYHYDFEDLT